MSPATGDTPFSASTANSVLSAACEAVGLDRTDARLLRIGENALFHLPAASIVVRIARTMDYWEDALKEVNVSRWLAESHIPAARLAQVDQPSEISGHPVTFWRFIEGRNGGRQDIVHLGTLLRRLHETAPPKNFKLPHENILGRVHKRIENSSVSTADKEFLLQRFMDLEAEVSRLRIRLLLLLHMGMLTFKTLWSAGGSLS